MYSIMLPIVSKNSVYCYGTFDASQKLRNSHEGLCLSVTTKPAAWRQIARLGGRPLYRMTRKGSRFLDAHKTASKQTELSKILDWARAEGLIEFNTVYRVFRYDSEFEDTFYSDYLTREEAEAECDEEDGIEEVQNVPVLTDKLAAMMLHDSRSIVFSTDFAMIAYADHLGLDGVWWDDRLDVASLSAPRGGILPARILEWDRKVVTRAPDEDE